MQRAHWIFALQFAACAERDPAFIPNAEFESELGFILFLDQAGVPIGQHGPILFDDPAPTRLELPEDAASMLLLGWSRTDLGERVPSFDASRVSAMRLHLEGESCERGRYAVDGSSLRLPLPEPTEWRLMREFEQWQPIESPGSPMQELGPLSLELIQDSSLCLGEDPPRFEPYGGIDPILREGDVVAGRSIERSELFLRGLDRLDDDRVLVTSRYFVLLLERGVPFRDEPGRAVQLLDPEGNFTLRDVVVDQDPGRGRGGLRVFVSAVEGDFVSAEQAGLLFELKLGPAGIELVATTTASETPIESLVINPADGRLLAGTRPAALYTNLPGEPLELVQLPTSDDKRVDLHLTGLEDRPYAIVGTAAGTLLLGDASAKNWVIEQGLPDGATFRGFAARHVEGRAELWVGDSNGDIFRNEAGGRWQKITPHVGPAYWSCFAQEQACRWYRPIQSTRAIIPLDDYDPGRVLLMFEGCMGMVTLRSDARCAVITQLGDRPIAPASAETSLVLARSNQAWANIPTQDGSIFELPRQPDE